MFDFSPCKFASTQILNVYLLFSVNLFIFIVDKKCLEIHALPNLVKILKDENFDQKKMSLK